MGSDIISDGSVLVPEDANCFMGAVNGQTVFSASNCGFNVVIDSADVSYGVTAAAITGAGETTLGFLDGNDGSSNDTRLTVFGEVSLIHHWLPELESRVSYSRSDYSASSLGSSTIADRVTVINIWTPARRWDFSVRGDWLQRKSSNEITQTFLAIDPDITVPGLPGAEIGSIVEATGLVAKNFDDSIDTEYWSVSGRAAYRVSRRGTVSLRVTYQHQDTNRAASRTNSTFENVLAIVGFRYDLDPFHF
jgi:maltoporin